MGANFLSALLSEYVDAVDNSSRSTKGNTMEDYITKFARLVNFDTKKGCDTAMATLLSSVAGIIERPAEDPLNGLTMRIDHQGLHLIESSKARATGSAGIFITFPPGVMVGALVQTVLHEGGPEIGTILTMLQLNEQVGDDVVFEESAKELEGLAVSLIRKIATNNSKFSSTLKPTLH